MEIALFGCGWLGLPLGRKLASKGISVTGTSTSQEKLAELKKNGISPFLFRGKMDLSNLEAAKWNSNIAIITIPPSGSNEYPELIGELVKILPQDCKIVFTSSIGVYASKEGRVDEQSICLSGHPVFRAEEVLRNLAGQRSVILRLGGLFGGERHPVYFLAGRTDLSQGKAPVNLVHLDDVIEAIEAFIEQEHFSGTYNLVYPDHPLKEAYYHEVAERNGLNKPLYKKDPTVGKIVVGDKIVRDLGFNYSHDLWTMF